MSEKLLLVDDEEGIRKVLGLSLREAGFEVRLAENGEQALSIFQQWRPAIVLTDIKMPGLDGIELLARIKKLDPDSEVIMITGHGDIDLAIQSIKGEATDFVTKPINEDVLEIALKRARERQDMRRELKRYTDNLEQLVAEKTRDLLAAERFAAVGQSAAGLSHAIKNIASGLEGAIFVLEKGRALDEKKYLDQGWNMLRANVEKIKNLSLELLSLSGTQMACLEPCDPNLPVLEVFELMRAAAAEDGVEIKLDLKADPAPRLFDPEGIHRCLLNLLGNAVDACLETAMQRPGLVTLGTKLEGDTLEYRVSDSGPGVSEAMREKLFSVVSSSKGSRGSGVGLLSTKKIVDAHGGSVGLLPGQPGQGAVFYLSIPARKAETN